MTFSHTNTLFPIQITSTDTPSGRFYTLPSGIKYPSITTILSIDPPIELINWRESIGQEQADIITKRGSDRGSIIHELCEKYLLNQDINLSDYDTEHIKLFNQIKYQVKNINNIRGLELPVYSDVLQIAGRTDCIGEFNNILSIIDFKTSTNVKDKYKITNYFIQATAYSLMVEELYGETIEDIVIIIATEKTMLPLVFKEKRTKYIKMLLDKIERFNEVRKNDL